MAQRLDAASVPTRRRTVPGRRGRRQPRTRWDRRPRCVRGHDVHPPDAASASTSRRRRRYSDHDAAMLHRSDAGSARTMRRAAPGRSNDAATNPTPSALPRDGVAAGARRSTTVQRTTDSMSSLPDADSVSTRRRAAPGRGRRRGRRRRGAPSGRGGLLTPGRQFEDEIATGAESRHEHDERDPSDAEHGRGSLPSRGGWSTITERTIPERTELWRPTLSAELHAWADDIALPPSAVGRWP